MAVGISSCRRPATETLAPGQPTMNELMHRSAEQRKAEEAKSRAQHERARNMTPGEAAKLESELRANPADMGEAGAAFRPLLSEKGLAKAESALALGNRL